IHTLPVRMKQHHDNVLEVIDYLQTKDEVIQINHPSVLTGALKKVADKQLLGYSGLLSFEVKHGNFKQIEAFMNALETIQIGVSWVGYESLAISPAKAYQPSEDQTGFSRLAVGLEGSALIIADLERAFSSRAEVMQNR